MNLRVLATQILSEVILKQRSLSDVLLSSLKKCKDPRDAALVQAMCFGVCRYYFRLTAIADLLLQKKLKTKDQDLYILILLGLYQLMEMRLPDYAAVSETVAAATLLKKAWAKNLINGVLRRYQREQETLSTAANQELTACYAHPLWMIQQIKQAYPGEWQAILNANNEHPPLALRVNKQKISRQDYLAKLNDLALTAIPIAETKTGIELAIPLAVSDIPGFAEGEVSVQDGAAQLAADLLQVEANMRVLDACAAPGGKMLHILETHPNVQIVAVEHEKNRLNSIQENLQRLNFSAQCILADAGKPNEWWDQQPFDRILLDAPCSGTGVIRRHPDIKLLRRSSDVQQFCEEQIRLLQALWPLLRQNGLLVYATCSIFPQENVENMQTFLTLHQDAKEEKILSEWGIPCTVGRQILPGVEGMDGFYYACMRKI
jgi:16S rRNA (cytosine967-C5)-methyltransferase